MKNKRKMSILEAWDSIEAADPDISTEQLFARVEDATGANAGDIAEALYSRRIRKEESK